MDKPAPTQYPIHDLLARRWSPHAFDSRPVEPEKLHHLFEAARWAASSFNEQPWNYIIAIKQNPEEFQQMLECLVEGNRPWASTAPVLVISVASTKFARNGTPNCHAFHDTGAASAHLTMQATAEGLFVHQMAGFDAQKARRTYQIPEGYDPVAAMAIGYPGDINTLPEPLKQRTLSPRSRKPIDQFVFEGKWGQRATTL
jgi:nitroreductase